MNDECKIDDIICQLEVLKNLRNLRTNMGSEAMLERFPELHGLENKLTESIEETEGDLKTAIAKCGQLSEEDSIRVVSPEMITRGYTEDEEADLEKED